MSNKFISIEDITKDLREIRDLARTDLAPMHMNMTQAEWDRHRVTRIAHDLTQLIEGLENPVHLD